MSEFNDKVALVTGGGSGIGAAISEKLVYKGARVVVAQRQESNIPGTDYLSVDFLDSSATLQLVDKIIDLYGGLDILVNNAGMMEESSIEEMDMSAWERTLRVNLTAPFQLIKQALPHLRKSQGNIINIGSIEGLGANPLHAAYCASKGGLHSLTRAVAVDHGNEGIRCNAVAPGWIDTALNVDFIESMPDPVGFKKDIGKIHPLGRTGKPGEVANLVCWLASEEAGFITGQIYTIDGGRMSKLSLP